jgi:hypothetical protein
MCCLAPNKSKISSSKKYLIRMEPTTQNIGIAITNPSDWTATALIAAAKQKNITPITLNLQNVEVKIHPDNPEPAKCRSQNPEWCPLQRK